MTLNDLWLRGRWNQYADGIILFVLTDDHLMHPCLLLLLDQSDRPTFIIQFSSMKSLPGFCTIFLPKMLAESLRPETRLSDPTERISRRLRSWVCHPWFEFRHSPPGVYWPFLCSTLSLHRVLPAEPLCSPCCIDSFNCLRTIPRICDRNYRVPKK